MKKTFLALAAMAMVFATSCNKDNGNTPEEPQDVTDNQFICEIDPTSNPQNAPRFVDGIGQMTYIDDNYVIWQVNDKIAYYGECTNDDIDGDYWYELTCKSTIENNRAYFTAEDESIGLLHFGQGEHKAYYPASLYTDGFLSLPNSIIVDSEHNDDKLPMYAQGQGAHYLTFHNICAVLQITIPAEITYCDKIELSANQNICGNFQIIEGGDRYFARVDGYPEYPTEAQRTITLEKQEENFGGYVYVAIPEGTYTGFNVKFYSGEDELGHTNNTSEDEIQLTTNKIYPVTCTSLILLSN
ncbi:MAG: hypothetical protein MJ002_09395 [Paludibacteraceae bacterium]|nr:hypothetical protein [Paludibacteraceae bacterium]